MAATGNKQEQQQQESSSTSKASESDEKPLALRKTPRMVVGHSLYRGMASQFQSPTSAKSKENLDASSPASKRATQSSETKADGGRNKRRASDQSSSASGGKRKKSNVKETERKHDGYCWTCHKEGLLVGCQVCPRAYHVKCASLEKDPDRDWVCAECNLVLKAENTDLRSSAMRALSVDQLCNLLKFAVSRMRMQCPDEFLKPVPLEVFPNYSNFVVHPMDLETLEKNIKQRMYGCTESFIADTKWILHNCIIFNGYQHKLTSMAKALLKTCKHEMSEIEVCPDCYSNAYTKRENWFQETCCPPHLLIWAKLKGFPFWPAKAMRVITGNVDVRFFGAHDRAWIPISQCFLLSSEVPTSMKVKKKSVFEHSMEELTQHIKKVKERFQVFQYAAFRSPLVAQDLNIHIQSMLPGVNLKDYCRSSVGTFRYLGSPFSPKDRQSVGCAAQSKSIKQESLSSFVAPADKPASGGARSDHSRGIKPRLECMKKLEVAIEKIKSFGKDFDTAIDKNLHGEASTSEPSEAPEESSAVPADTDSGGGAKELPAGLVGAGENTSSDDATSEGENKLDEEPEVSLPLNSAEACEVSSTTCVPEAATFVDECVATSPSVASVNVPTTALESLENFVEAKLTGREPESTDESSDAENPANIVPIKDDVAFEPEDAATAMPTVDPDVALESDKSPDTAVEPDLPPSAPASPDDQQLRSPDPGAEEEAMDTGEGDASEAGSNDGVTGREEKLSEVVDRGCLPKEDAEESRVNAELEDASDLNLDSDSGTKSIETPSDPRDEKDREVVEPEVSSEEKDAEDKSEPAAEDATSKESVTDPSADLGPTALAEEGDLVIDLDRDREEEAQNSVKAKKRNSRSPFGGIKLKEKTPPKDKKQHAPSAKAKGKSNPPPPSDRLPVDAGCSPSVSVGNGNRTCANLPVLSPLGLRNSVSVLQTQQVSRTMPTLQPRPHPPASSLGSSGSGACHQSPGSSSTGLNKYSQKMVDFVRGTMEEMFNDMAKTGNTEATIKALHLEMEKMQWHHQQEMAEMKHNTDLILLEMRNSMEVEKQRFVAEVRRQGEIDKQKSIEETKKKQWCAFCGKEAIFYCCWNTSYCDYPCQQAHWPRHVNTCSQNQASGEQGAKDPASDSGAARPQSRKHNAKNSKKSEQASEQQQHQQILMGHHQMQGCGSMASALTSVQVIPQSGGMRGGPSLQVQYIGSSPQTSVLPTITMQHSPTVTAQFATVATPSGYPLQQGMPGASQGAMFQQRPIQSSNLLFPVVSTHQARPIVHHQSHLPQNTQILVSHGMRSQPSLSFIRGAPHPHRGRPSYMM